MRNINYFLISGFLFGTLPVFGQALSQADYHSNSISVQSPNAASLGRYGEVPVNLFTGVPDISVPLTNISYGGIEVPITLSYNGGGLQVAAIPGWAGLGWTLLSGGQISRKVHYFPDEFNNPNPAFFPYDRGYYFEQEHGKLDNPNWNTSSFIFDKINFDKLPNNTSPQLLDEVMIIGDAEPDEFMFNFNGYSGSFYMSEKGEWKVKSRQNITFEVSSELTTAQAPAGSSSAGLYLVHGNPDNNTVFEYASSIFTKFTITTPDGYQYIFGGNEEAIEFTRTPVPSSAYFTDLVDTRSNHITANTWNLTKIISPDGKSIDLNYKRGKVLFQKRRVYTTGYFDTPNPILDGPTTQSMTISAINPSYLTSIETPFKRIDFVTSNATELKPTDLICTGNVSDFNKTISLFYADLTYAYNTSSLPNYNQQLDSIKVFDKQKGAYTKGFKFFQSSDVSRRRTMDSLMEFSFTEQVSEPVYKFSYSVVSSMPAYESLSIDHWGYYAGTIDPPYYSSSLPVRSYYGTGSMTGNGYALDGLIDKITYPTGGTTEFDFETNKYGKVVTFKPNTPNPVQLTTNVGNCGARIKKITSTDQYGAPIVTKEYFYVTNYVGGGNLSSGILAGYPRYVDAVQYTSPLYSWDPGCDSGSNYHLINNCDDNSEWMDQLHGGYVGYSEVTVKNADGSYVVSRFSNSDQQQYRDEMHNGYASLYINPSLDSNYRITSNDLERGKILNESFYKNDNSKVKERIYTYVDDPARKNKFVKAFAHKMLISAKVCGNGNIPLIRAFTYKIYHYMNPLKSLNEILYEPSGSISNSTTYDYDEYGNITTTRTKTSDQRLVLENTKYNSDPDYLAGTATTTTAQGIRNLSTVFHIKNYPVEQTTLISPDPDYGTVPINDIRLAGGTLFQYYTGKPTVSKVLKMELTEPFPPFYISGGQVIDNFSDSRIENGNLVFDSRYEVQETITPYTQGNKGKPATVTDKGGVTAYTWDYSGAYVTSITQGAVKNEIAFTSFEGGNDYTAMGVQDDNKGNWDFNKTYITTIGFTGNKSLDISAQKVKSTINIPSGKNYWVSFWAKGSGAPQLTLGSTVLGQLYIPVKTAGDWKLYRIKITGNGGQLSIIRYGTGVMSLLIDELRLYPEGAMMKSYNYDPATGNVLSICDESDKPSFYIYDGLGRLILIKDEEGSILKKLDYTVQG